MNRAQRRSKPAPAGKVINLPLLRYTQAVETRLQLDPHVALDAFREGTATKESWDTLAYRLQWGAVMARDHYPDAVQTIHEAQVAMLSVQDRHTRTGRWGMAGREFYDIGAGLNCTDTMQLGTTKKEQVAAIRAVFEQVNKLEKAA